jgi:hypothetical protein
MAQDEELLRRIALLEHQLEVLTEGRLGLLEDVAAIERIQYAYGYYLDNLLYDPIADLFADEGAAIEIGGRGRYTGKDNVRRFLHQVLGDGEPGLRQGQVINHVQLQPIVTVSPDRRRAQVRCRALIQSNSPAPAEGRLAAQPGQEGSMMWAEGVYENTFVRERGSWRIGLLWWVPTFYVAHPYQRFWQDSSPPSKSFPPQSPSPPPLSGLGRLFLPFHYPHPVTGRMIPASEAVRKGGA